MSYRVYLYDDAGMTISNKNYEIAALDENNSYYCLVKTSISSLPNGGYAADLAFPNRQFKLAIVINHFTPSAKFRPIFISDLNGGKADTDIHVIARSTMLPIAKNRSIELVKQDIDEYIAMQHWNAEEEKEVRKFIELIKFSFSWKDFNNITEEWREYLKNDVGINANFL